MANMQNMMKQMQKMQRNMAKLQEELAETPVVGTAGGGIVKVTVNGASQMLSIELAEEVVDPEDIEMLQDLIVAATNDAMNNAAKLSEERMGALTKGMKMPGGMGGDVLMLPYQDAIGEMIDAFARLPGISRRGAERLTYHLLQAPEELSDSLARAVYNGRHSIHYCKRCFNLTDEELCPICKSSKRDPHQVCVVEEARDINALEHSGSYRGLYHVLGGVISPMDGIGPDELHIKALLARIDNEPIEEVIIALNASVEGEATTLYLISQLQKKNVKVSRIAQGLSAGSDIKYADQMTLSRALEGRTEISY